jgi:hypothetical protein
MIGYACLLLAETLTALALLGLVGGWVLWPFRTAARPYLWLAAPMAGLALLSLFLTICYHSCGLSIPLCLAAALPLNMAPTLVFLVRRWRQGGTLPGWKLALAVLLGVSAFCTYYANRTAIRWAEPTVCMRDGSDTFGYAQVGSWFLQHPQEQASWSPGKPQQAYIYVMDSDPRPGAYFLAAAAGCVRGTSALFSFDWLTGIVLSAGLLALVGAFASGRSEVLFLLAAGFLSSWCTLSRSGYFGKILAYPGCILLAFVFFETWRQFALKRLIAAVFLGLGVGLCHSPATPLTILGLLLGGAALALGTHWLLGNSVPDLLRDRRLDWRQLSKGLFVFAILVGPLMGLYSFWLWGMATTPPTLEMAKMRLFSFALDVDNPHVSFTGPRLATWLVCLALSLNVVGFFLAYLARQIEAASFLLSVGVLVIAWRGHIWGLSHFSGILFPLSAVGIVLLREKQQQDRAPRFLIAATLVVGLAMLGLRWFQFEGSYQRYKFPANSPYCFRQSSIATLRRIIGDKSVDVSVSDLYTSILLMIELGGQGPHLQIQAPTWARVVAYTQWPVPAYPHKGDFLLCDGEASRPAELVRFRTAQFQLLSDTSILTRGAASEENCEKP